jgi:hypothetical protein
VKPRAVAGNARHLTMKPFIDFVSCYGAVVERAKNYFENVEILSALKICLCNFPKKIYFFFVLDF